MTLGRMFVLAAASAALAAAGCGGSEGMSRDQVQQSAWQFVKDKVPVDTSVDDVGCVSDGGGKWSCLTYARPVGGAAVPVSIQVTCDDVNCLYEAR